MNTKSRFIAVTASMIRPEEISGRGRAISATNVVTVVPSS
jgi:hypothetical protein